ncbi:MAG: ABC transporter ATP-binding protein [Henriciella sp.]|uniref:ABC transporter ATP-binding protein n=1 Tax=Henriciella sp. TaxID=1968823 RepID=UPI003C717432
MIRFDIPEAGISLDGRTALHPFSAELESDQIIGIVGPNGAGKSTLIRLLAGLLPASPESVWLDGKPLAAFTGLERARRIAWLSQTRELSWDLLVEDVVALGRHAWGGGRFDRLGEADRNLVFSAMARAGAAGLAGRHVLSLSGGEQARVHLARLLAVGAGNLLLDEPLASLDIAQQLGMLTALREEAAQGKLVCLALHDLSLARSVCDQLLVLKEGRLIADGPPATILTGELLETVFGVRENDAGGFVLSN